MRRAQRTPATRTARRLAGGVAAALACAAVLALLVGGGGCELVVSDDLPSFSCLADAADTCPAGEVCIPSSHKCVTRSSTCTLGPHCGPGLRCDTETLQCDPEVATQDAADDADGTSIPPADSAADAPGTPGTDAPTGDALVSDAADASMDVLDAPAGCRGVTCSCVHNPDCDSGICAGELTETTPLSTAIGSFCTQACCSSADCPPSTVCFGTGGGGSYCVSPGWIGRQTELGGGVGGATCSGDGACRSGLCVNGTCADTCCSNSPQSVTCATGTVCRYSTFPGKTFDTHETAWCGAAIGNSAAGAPCAVDATCQSGKCGLTRCEAVCRTSTDCSGTGQQCSYGLAPTTLPSNTDIVAGCMSGAGVSANGIACMANGDCQSDFCDGNRLCTDVCATDADCKGGLHCRPVIVNVQGNYSVLGCEGS